MLKYRDCIGLHQYDLSGLNSMKRTFAIFSEKTHLFRSYLGKTDRARQQVNTAIKAGLKNVN